VPGASPSSGEQVRAAELLAGMCLATDLGRGFPLEHGLHSTLVAMRLCERLGVDRGTAAQAYYGCLLFYVGCTADAEVAAELFDDGMLSRHFDPVIYGSPGQVLGGVVRALAGSGPVPVQAARVVRRLPRAVAGHRRHMAALCEVGRMLSARMGVPPEVPPLFTVFTERWDGRGEPGRVEGDDLPAALRIMQVAQDAAYQDLAGGREHAVRVVTERAGHAFDPAVVAALRADADAVLAGPGDGSVWDGVLAAEPDPPLVLGTGEIDRAVAAVGDFADLVSPYLVGHSSGVAALAAAAGRHCGLPDAVVRDLWRAGAVHDVGHVAVSAAVWQKPGTLSTDERERVRLHAYHGERVLCRSPFLAGLLPLAGAHHERLDGSGYHRGSTGPALPPAARLLAAADAYRAMTEPRPHREALSTRQAADALGREVAAGRFDGVSVAAVLAAAGQPALRLGRPAGLTEREMQVVVLLARGLQTKQVGRALGISVKTADHHVQHAYAKIGVSTRAAVAVFAMEHGLLQWGELRYRPPTGVPSVPAEDPATGPGEGREAVMARVDEVSGRDSAQGAAEIRDRAQVRIAGWAGIAGPVLFTATFLALEQLRRGEFSPVELPVSALEAGPYGWVQQVNFALFGLLTLAFAVGLHRGLRPIRWGAAGPALFGLTGVALLTVAVLPLRQDAAGEIYDPGGHVVGGFTFFLGSTLALMVLSRRVAADPAWSRLAGWTLAAGIACLIGFVVTGTLVMPDDALLHDRAGLVQRAVILCALFPMRIALSLRLLKAADRAVTG
jgi:HD-GYP domain-containing protein (c-di-GMP phosphodiesterase class II)/hypothetical membrane protein